LRGNVPLRKKGSICTIFEFEIEVSFTNIFSFVSATLINSGECDFR